MIIVNEAAHIRVNKDGTVIAQGDFGAFSITSKDRYWIKNKYPEVREKIEARHLAKLQIEKKDAEKPETKPVVKQPNKEVKPETKPVTKPVSVKEEKKEVFAPMEPAK